MRECLNTYRKKGNKISVRVGLECYRPMQKEMLFCLQGNRIFACLFSNVL